MSSSREKIHFFLSIWSAFLPPLRSRIPLFIKIPCPSSGMNLHEADPTRNYLDSRTGSLSLLSRRVLRYSSLVVGKIFGGWMLEKLRSTVNNSNNTKMVLYNFCLDLDCGQSKIYFVSIWIIVFYNIVPLLMLCIPYTVPPYIFLYYDAVVMV